MNSSSWKNFTIVDAPMSLGLSFSDKVKRIDIRFKKEGKFTKYGVSLTPSEMEFCASFARNFQESPSKASFYSLVLEKSGENGFRIKKKDKEVLTNLLFWNQITPYIPAVKYLCLKDGINVETILDLYLCCQYLSKEEVLAKKWYSNANIIKDNIDGSFLVKLGFVQLNQYETRTIDTEEMDQFAEHLPETFASIVKMIFREQESLYKGKQE